MKKIICNSIKYRQGFIEITANIHNEHINLETWSVHPDINISEIELADKNFPDSGVIGNTEIELDLDDARILIEMLSQAIVDVECTNEQN